MEFEQADASGERFTVTREEVVQETGDQRRIAARMDVEPDGPVVSGRDAGKVCRPRGGAKAKRGQEDG